MACGIRRASRIALVYRESHVEFQFFETVVYDRGFQVRVFRDREAVARWLIEDEDSRIG